eukprot:scaffold18529_cov78-Skeletonema_marinoi.AAC.1
MDLQKACARILAQAIVLYSKLTRRIACARILAQAIVLKAYKKNSLRKRAIFINILPRRLTYTYNYKLLCRNSSCAIKDSLRKLACTR